MTTSPFLCILTDPSACGVEDWGHYCSRPIAHDDPHRCDCGQEWPTNPEYELACRLYVAHWSTVSAHPELHPDWEPPEVPTRRVVRAACWFPASQWRVLARVAAEALGVTL